MVIYLIISIIGIITEGNSINNQFTIVTFILSCIIIPLQCVAEEYFIRGYLMQAIGSWFKIPVIAILVQAIFFAAIHPYNTLGVMSTLITGICYGAITYYSKGIEMSSALHIVNNLLAFWLTGLGLVKIGSNVNITSFLSDLIVMLATILIVYYVSKKQNWFETSTEY